MKFEIDDITGMVNTEDFDEYWEHVDKGLDAIDQAVKKTKEKIQDSTHYISLEPQEALEFVDVDPKIIKVVAHENDVEISKGNFIPIQKIEQNKEDARLYSALKHIIQSNLNIPHNLTSKPDDEYQIDYPSRLIAAEMIAVEFKKLTGKDIKELS